jgi:hypothetical protein
VLSYGDDEEANQKEDRVKFIEFDANNSILPRKKTSLNFSEVSVETNMKFGSNSEII